MQNKMSRKNSKPLRKALVIDGMIRCPDCGALLGKAYYGANATGIELWCDGKNCHKPVRVELKESVCCPSSNGRESAL